MEKSQEENTDPSVKTDWTAIIKLLTTVIKEVGLPGFFAISGVLFLYVFATPEQKQRFIDKWFLLDSFDHLNCYVIIGGLLAIILIGGSYLRLRIKSLKDENTRIGQEKSDLQNLMLKGRTSTSKKPKK